MKDLDRVRRAFVEDLRDELAALAPSMPPLPLPSDVEAERELIGLALRCERAVAETGLLAMAFYTPLHRDLWASIDAIQRLVGAMDGGRYILKAERSEFMSKVALCMEALDKYSPATVVSELEWLEEYPRTRSPGELIRVVSEKHRARKLCDWLRRIDEDLRLGRIDSKKAMERLGKAQK